MKNKANPVSRTPDSPASLHTSPREAVSVEKEADLAPAPPTGYLARWFDGGLDLPEDLTEQVIRADEIGRLTRTLSIVLWTTGLPRRLGDVTDEELALDKKRARRTAWALSQALRAWAGNRRPGIKASEEIRIAGAQLLWPQFKAEHSAQVNERLRIVSTWALMTDNADIGKRAVVKLNNELSWVDYALRD